MKKKSLVLTGIGIVVVLVGVGAVVGPKLYREVVAASNAEVPSLGISDTTISESETSEPESFAGEWFLTNGSQAGYRVDEVLNGTDVTVTGRTDELTGTLTIEADDKDAEDGTLTLSAAEFTVDVASISTDNPSRDSYFAERAIDTTQYPEATFSLSEPVSFDRIPEQGDVEQVAAVGDLTIAGVTQQVTVDVAVRSDGNVAEVAGSIPITFANFGVEAPDFNFVRVEPTGYVEFQLTATKA